MKNLSATRLRIALGVLVGSLASVALAATFNLFQPATGILKGNSSTYVTTAATSSDVIVLWTGPCNSSSFLRGDGACTPGGGGSGSVTSVGLSVPTGLSVTGSPVTTTGTLGITTALNGPVRGNGSGFLTGSTSLTSEVSGLLPVANGGIGVGTLTGLVKGNGTSPFSAAASSDVISLWSGTCNASSFLRGDGACAASGTGTVTSVSLTAPAIFSITGSPVTTTGTLGLVAAGTSGGIPFFDSATTLASSGALTANRIVLGGGAGAAPTPLGSLGTTTTLLHGNAAGAPTFGAVSLTTDVSGTLPVANGGTGTTTSTGTGSTVLSASPAFTGSPTVGGSGICRADGTNCPASTAPITCTTACNISAIVAGQSAMIRKGTLTAITSDSSNNIDPDLQFTSTPAGTFQFTFCLQFTGTTTTTQGYRFSFDRSTAGSNVGGYTGTYDVSGVATAFTGVGLASTASPGMPVVAADVALAGSAACGTGWFISVGATTFGFNWAQEASTANATNLIAGSTVILTRLN